ncbi:MAG: 2-oxo acid dehydrogenase subunit E2 [Planctomycetota bacterium]
MGVEIRVPRLGWSMEEGTFSAWLAQAGSAVRAGQPLFCLEGEKATQDIESIGEGILHLAPDAPAPGQVVPVGKMIGMLCAAGEEPRWDSPAEPPSSPPVSTARTPMMPVPSPAEAPTMPAAPPSVRRLARQMGIDLAKVKPSWPGGRIGRHDLQPISRSAPERPAGEAPAAITPRARRLAKNAGVSLACVTGTGKGGRVRERDVRALAGNDAEIPGGRIVPVSAIRRLIARNMVASRQSGVPVTLTARADASGLLDARARLKESDGDKAPTLNDMILFLLGRLLQAHPILAARWLETRMALPPDDGFHIGLAVDTPEGLLVPVIRDTARATLGAVAEQSRSLVERARAGRLKSADMKGGVFTLTSLGTFGIGHFNPVINHPESAILGLGAIVKDPVPAEPNGFHFRPTLPLSLTFDHRVVDGAPAARFLQSLAEAIAKFSPPC